MDDLEPLRQVCRAEIIGTQGYADLAGVDRRTTNVWLYRGIRLAPLMVVDGKPLWLRSDVIRHLQEQGRMAQA
jgi:hypothetical protein